MLLPEEWEEVRLELISLFTKRETLRHAQADARIDRKVRELNLLNNADGKNADQRLEHALIMQIGDAEFRNLQEIERLRDLDVAQINAECEVVLAYLNHAR